MIEYLDPRAEPGRPVTPYDLSLDDGAPVVVGLLANGFPDSVQFLDEVERAVERLEPGVVVRRYEKPNASMVASDQLLDGISAECSAAVTAYGH